MVMANSNTEAAASHQQHRHDSTSSTDTEDSDVTLANNCSEQSPSMRVKSLRNLSGGRASPQIQAPSSLPLPRSWQPNDFLDSCQPCCAVSDLNSPHSAPPPEPPTEQFGIDLNNGNPLSPNEVEDRQRQRIDLLRLIVTQLGGINFTTLPTAKTRTDGIKVFTLTGVQIAILVCPALYAIAVLTFQALSYFATVEEKASSDMAKVHGVTYDDVKRLLELEINQVNYRKAQASRMTDVLHAMQEMVESCGPHQVTFLLLLQKLELRKPFCLERH